MSPSSSLSKVVASPRTSARRWRLPLLFAATLFALTGAVTRSALAYDQLTMGGGPVLSPDIVPLFWGKWTLGNPPSETDRNHVRAYIDGFASYVSGGYDPPGQEPVLKQYGVWGATRVHGDFVDPGTNDTKIQNTGVYQRIHLLQSQGKLPPNTPNRVFVVFLKGFTYDFTDASGYESIDCAYHSLNNGTYYAVVPVDYPGYGLVTVNGKQVLGIDNHCLEISSAKTNIPLFQQMISHELGEAMTDPYIANGWVTNDFPFGFSHSEAGDNCESQNTTLTFSDGYTGTQTATVQTFSDNISQGCASFTAMTTPRLGVTTGISGLVDVFYPNGWGGQLGHVTENSDGTWVSETITKPGVPFYGPPFLYAPAAVVPATNRLDVFVRGADGVLNQVTKIGTGGWTFKTMPSSSSTIGQPAAVVTGQDFIEVAVQKTDSSVGHYAWYDTTTPSLSSLGGQSIGPPVMTTRGSSGLLDILTFGMHADVVESTRSNGTFSGFNVLVAGSNDNTPYPPAVVSWDAKHEDVYLRGAGNSVVTRYNSGWSGRWIGFGNPTSGTYTKAALATAANWWQPGEYDVVWQNAADNTYSAIHVSNNGASFGPITKLGGQRYVSPPSVIYGNDGWPYIFGMGTDGCLYYTNVDWWSGGGVGPTNWTGVCDLQ